MNRFSIGDIIDYSFFSNLKISDVDEEYYYLTDSSGCIKHIYKSLINKYGKLIESSSV